MNKVYYYELCFYHDEDDALATEDRCSYCIKTEIPPVIDDKVALSILFGSEKGDTYAGLRDNLTCVMEISEVEALEYFDVEGLCNRIEGEHGVYYTREKHI